MSDLLNLASEPFGDIVSYLNTHEWTTLWLCGNVRLRWRLSKGRAVRNMVLEFHHPNKWNWPSHIAELDGLETFVLKSRFVTLVPQLHALHLAILTHNLKKLVLDCSSAGTAMKELMSSSPQHFPYLETLCITMYPFQPEYQADKQAIRRTTFADRNTNQSHGLFEIPLTVTDLKILNSHSSSKSRRGVVKVFLSKLPPYLTNFECPGGIFVIEDGHRFPSTLKSLKLDFLSPPCQMPLVLLQILPVDLEHLSLDSAPLYLVYLTIDDWTVLNKLQKLKTLTIATSGFFEAEEATLLPRTLECFHLEHRSEYSAASMIDILRSLPPGLTDLQGIECPVVTREVARSFPRALKTCDAGLQYDLEAISCVPDCFEGPIRLVYEETQDYDFTASFPQNLRILRLHGFPALFPELLPHHLESLILTSAHLVLTADMAAALPRTLTELRIPRATEPLPNMDLVFKALPPSLTSFVATTEPFIKPIPTPPNASINLPRTIKELGLVLDFPESGMAAFFAGLPKNLTKLECDIFHLEKSGFGPINTLPALKHLDINIRLAPDGGLAQYIPFHILPRELAHFTLKSYLGQTDIVNDTLKDAPPNLSFLSLPESPLLTRGCLQHLPLSLGSLLIHGDIPQWFPKRGTLTSTNIGQD
jgi:hypothetical protein